MKKVTFFDDKCYQKTMKMAKKTPKIDDLLQWKKLNLK